MLFISQAKHTFPNSKYVVLVNRNLFAGKWKIGGRAFQSSTVLISPVQTFTNRFFTQAGAFVSKLLRLVAEKEKEGREGRKRRNFFNLSLCFVVQACLDSGFFYVINHGISQEFMDEVFAQSKRFFTLPLSEKMKHLRNEKHRGYTPVLDEVLDPENQVNGDYKEGYYIGVEVPEHDPKSEKPFYGPNVWPAAEDRLPEWRQTMEKFHQEALEVAKAVARIIALALDLERDFFDKPEMLGNPIATLRLLHYEGGNQIEGQISDPLKGIYGAGAHSDYGLITLLANR
ncbi:2-oxoglutarate-Fe(II) type oxidoreductase [Vitis vinifera]|uniref:2-oxoglutarate-Fe(II) type oxidoreductase n=1 Tax=Vitis vinifera TaxID=29760 RepID=A0A438II35_VITVI|nr:2-oxoglutarate-Fe(II) type oxidoreductase [Vitis vinifera]